VPALAERFRVGVATRWQRSGDGRGREGARRGPSWDLTTGLLDAAEHPRHRGLRAVVEPDKLFPHLAPAAAGFLVEEMLRDSNVIKKYQKLAVLADGSTTLSWMAAEKAALDDLILLRNKLVHFKAEPPWGRSTHNNVKQRLALRFAGSRVHANVDFFPNGFESYECAKWCVETARAFIVAFAARYGWPVAFVTKPVHAERLKLP